MTVDILELKNVLNTRLEVFLEVYSEEAFKIILQSLSVHKKDSWRYYFENSREYGSIVGFITRSSLFCDEMMYKLFTDLIIPRFNTSEDISRVLRCEEDTSSHKGSFLLTFESEEVPIRYKPKVFLFLYYKELLRIFPEFPKELLKFVESFNFISSTYHLLSQDGFLVVKPNLNNQQTSQTQLNLL